VDSITKQPDESFFIDADFSKVLIEGETINLSDSTVSAVDVNGSDVTTVVLDLTTKAVEDAKLRIRILDGVSDDSPYKITFKAVTSDSNIYELDVLLKVEEI